MKQKNDLSKAECPEGTESGTECLEEKEAQAAPAVSICVPCYNNASQVKKLLSTVAEQTLQDIEVILSDDSTDSRIQELAERIREEKEPGISWEGAGRKLRYAHNEKPLGHIFNWNHALDMAQGRYIKIMFSDDWFTYPDSLEKLAVMLDERPDASLAFCGTMQVSEKRTWTRAANDAYLERLRTDYRHLFLGNEIGAPSATIYRACGARFDEKSNWASDMFLYFEILQKNPYFAATKEPLISIGIHEEQYTGMFAEKDIRKYQDSLLMYQKYGLSANEACRREMLRLTVMYGQGWKRALSCGASFPEYMKERARWFWHNTVLGYWNGLRHKLGLARGGA